jgi:hypothetical protein
MTNKEPAKATTKAKQNPQLGEGMTSSGKEFAVRLTLVEEAVYGA